VGGEGQFHSAVILLVDALRYDFTVWDSQYNETYPPPHYINKLPTIHHYLHHDSQNENHSPRSHLFRFKADPPTATLQRLKALTTGTLPTFIDIGSNFGGSEITEDNLISHIRDLNKTSIFMGDDTWMSLYPHHFNKSYPYPSLNVWDLDTVDNGCLSHIFDAISMKPIPSLIISHFLGVDHAGHRYGPDHPEMSRKLTEMDNVIKKVIESVPEGVLVVVMGDHGMDDKGDHGGESSKETDAALFLYSKSGFGSNPLSSGLFAKYTPPSKSLFSSIMTEIDPDYVSGLEPRTIPQIDIVPTLSLLLALPIPFNNLGVVIPELFFHGQTDEERMTNLLNTARINCHQVFDYLQSYGDIGGVRDNLLQSWRELEITYETISTNNSPHNNNNGASNVGWFTRTSSNDQLKEQSNLIVKYLLLTRNVLLECRKVWAQFDVILVWAGVLAGISSLLFNGYLVYHMGNLKSWKSFFTFVLVGSILTSLLGNVIVMVFKLNSGWSLLQRACLGCNLGAGLYVLHSIGTYNIKLIKSKLDLETFIGIVMAIIPAILHGGDRFIIWEDLVVTVVLLLFAVFIMVRSWQKSGEGMGTVIISGMGFIIGLMIMQLITVCRDEQMPHCAPTFFGSTTSSVTTAEILVLLWFSGIFFILGNNYILSGAESYNGIAPIVSGFLVPGAILGSALYWTLDTIDAWGLGSSWDWTNWVKNWFVKVLFLPCAFSAFFAWVNAPSILGVKIHYSHQNTNTEKNHNNTKEKQPQQQQNAIVVSGIRNAVGGAYAVGWSALAVLISIVMKPMGGVMIFLACGMVACLISMKLGWEQCVEEAISRQRRIESRKPANIIREQLEAKSSHSSSLPSNGSHTHPNSFLSIIFISSNFLLSHRLFFSTGHQSNFSSIQWSVGFIGLTDLNYYISGALVFFNYFGSYVLMVAAVPLLLTWQVPLLEGQENQLKSNIGMGIVWYLFTNGFDTLITIITAAWLRRHLMVWKVFAPRFILGSGILVLSCISVIFCLLGVIKIIHGYEEEVSKITELANRKFGKPGDEKEN